MPEQTKESSNEAVRVCVEPIPLWIDVARWLGPFAWQLSPTPTGSRSAEARMSRVDAAWLAARLRGLGIDGAALSVRMEPQLPRAVVRAALLREARARRDITPGFLRKSAQATDEGRYSLTPESIALAMAAQAAGRSVVDACCGSGGNAIAFARAGCRVIAVDVDAARLAEARHNAKLYGVEQKLRFIQGDASTIVPEQAGELLFIDPPWGADYDKRATQLASFPLLAALLSSPKQLAHYPEIWLKLPASFATASLAGAEVQAWFGEAPGDRQRVKFLQLKLKPGFGATSA